MFVKLKQVLFARIQRLGNREKIELGLIMKEWPEVISQLVREEKINPALVSELSNTQPIKLENNVLMIKVKNQAIASELSVVGYDLMEKLNKRIGRKAIKRLFFKIKK